MKKYLIQIVFLSFLLSPVAAQDYTTGIGLRGGPSNGLTIKHFLGDNAAIEGLFASRWNGFNITVLYELHHSFFDINRMNFYYGIGGHLGRWNGDKNPWFNDTNDHLVIGADAILGLEYNFEEIPFNISIDYKPAFNIVGYNGFWGDEGAFSIRYIF